MGELFPTARAAVLAPGRVVRWLGRDIARRARLLAIFAAVLIALHLIATLVTGLMLRQEAARLRTAGVLLRFEDIVPRLPAGAENAADIYQKAFDADRLSNEDKATLFGVDPSEWGPEQFARAGPILTANEGYFRLLEEASRIPNCVFPVAWDRPLAAVFPHYARMREGARMLRARAALAAGSGRVDAALADCSTMLRIAEHAKADPVIIGQLVAYAIQRFAVEALEQACSMGTPTPAAYRDLFDQIAAIDQVTPCLRSMEGEIVLWGGGTFRLVRRGGGGIGDLLDALSLGGWRQVWLFRLYGTVGRPLLNLDERNYLRHMAEQVEVFSLPWSESHRREDALIREQEQLPMYRSLLSRMLVPVHPSILWSRETSTASLGSAQIALALVAHRVANGSYPESLDELQAAGWKLPKDPFHGTPYHYSREGNGFIVESRGSGLLDYGGIAYKVATWKLSAAEAKQRTEHWDLQFHRPL